MRYMLDTQMLIWAAAAPERLPAFAHDVLQSENLIGLSVLCIWEIGLKRRSKHPGFSGEPDDFAGWADANRFEWLALNVDHVLAAQSLPPVHNDPFDRMLVAQARVEGLLLITADKTIAQYPGPIQLIH